MKTPDKPANTSASTGVVENPWERLRQFTDARIALGRAGVSLPTRALLEFQLAHAQARDAVHIPLDIEALAQEIAGIGELSQHTPPVTLHSQASDRTTYLQRPDYGRQLDDASKDRLKTLVAGADTGREHEYDLALVVVDGLSSFATAQNTLPFLKALLKQIAGDSSSWSLAPVTLVEQGRVAIGDEIGHLLNARAVVVLIGERPGLSSPDSLGLYLTWAPEPGLTDSRRNCISNIRPGGLSYDEAGRRLFHLLAEARRQKLSGVQLKDRSEEQALPHNANTGNFLLS